MPFPLIPLLIGAGLGAATSPDDRLKGALLGGALGGVGGGLLGAGGGAAAATPTASPVLPGLGAELAGTAGGVADLGGALKATSLLPQEAPGFKQQLALGLLNNAGSFIPQQQQQQQPQAPTGSLKRPAFQPSQNLFLNFRRRRR